MYKKPVLFGRNEDGVYEGRIEDIGVSPDYDTLYISNRVPNPWIFSIFNGYRQIGTFSIKNPHKFMAGQKVIVTIIDDKIVEVI